MSIFNQILVIFRRIFMKVRTVNFQGNSFSGSRADTWGRTDGHDEGNRRFSRI